ncbi:MAG TPA: hypothetical protein VN306_19580 [Mycobacterium sp.]|nr:hypothetical protein [Mycobacterium sp.]
MARILVAGGCYEEDKDKQLSDARNQFASALGKEIIDRGHVLLGGCRTGLDAMVANAAHEAASERGLDPKNVIKSWVTSGTKPSHDKGEIIKSRVPDWSHVPRRYTYPEPIKQADVVMIIGGWDGTHYAASWARLASKPLLPVAAFGLAAAEIFDDELADFDRRYGTRLSLDEYQILNRLVGNWSKEVVSDFARDIISLAERIIVSTEVFVIMSFAEKGYLKDAYKTFCRVCMDFNLHAFKIDDHFDAHQRIIPNIIEAIRRCAFIIADLSEPRPNVYYELGYAQALGKNVITTACQGTELPFDIFDVPTQYWDCQDTLECKLEAALLHMGYKKSVKGKTTP